jgi:TolB-like protein
VDEGNKGLSESSVECLRGWKTIARFLGRETRTVQLWERERGLPVHRLPGQPGQSVYAYPHELAAWRSGGVAHKPLLIAAHARERAPGLLVLPFEFHAQGDSDVASVGDTLAQELLHRLTVTPPRDLRVLSWTTSRSYQRAIRRADEIGLMSDVRYLVEGVVQQKGSRWCVDIRMVDARDDHVEFADRFVATGPDILSLQSIIAEAVSAQLSLHIGGLLIEPFWNEPVSPQAFRSYVAAAQRGANPNAQDLRAALTHADEACTLDSTFVPAQILRASLQIQLVRYASGSITEQGAKGLALQCIRAAPRLATSKALDALVSTVFDHDWERADRRYAEIISALPACLGAWTDSATNLSVRRRYEEAQSAIDGASAIERSPQVLQAQAYLHIWKGEYEPAALLHDRILAHREFQFPTAVMQAMVVGLMLRDETRMRALIERFDPETLHACRYFMAACVAASTRQSDALSTAHAELAAAAESGHAMWYHVALLDGYMGDALKAALHLGRAIDYREPPVKNAAVAPCFGAVRDDPRFRAQLSRLNLC